MGKGTVAIDRRKLGAVVKALADYMLWHAAMSENSFSQFRDGEPIWNKNVWRAGDPDGLKRYEKARRAIDGLTR